MEHIKKQKAYQNDQRIDQLKAKSLSKHKTRRVMEHINVKHLVVEQFVGSITRVHWIVGDMVGSNRCSQYSPSAI
jgi:hypothetical protein